MLNWTQEKDITEKQVEGSSTPKLTVESTGNHVYFYSDINSDRCLALMKEIRAIDNMLRVERASRNIPVENHMVPIWLHVNSYGGSLFDGFGIADQLATIKSPIYSIIEGCCASAGTLLSMSCTRRYIMPSAFVLIHQLSSLCWGTYEQFTDEMHVLDMAMKTITNFYHKHSNLDKKTIRAILKRDSWFDAKECVKNGFVDEIYK